MSHWSYHIEYLFLILCRILCWLMWWLRPFVFVSSSVLLGILFALQETLDTRFRRRV